MLNTLPQLLDTFNVGFASSAMVLSSRPSHYFDRRIDIFLLLGVSICSRM